MHCVPRTGTLYIISTICRPRYYIMLDFFLYVKVTNREAMDYRSWHSLFTITALWLLGQCLCYGPISQNSVTFASPPSQNDGLKFLGGANDYGLASPPTSSSVVTSGSVVPRHYWWQQEPNPFVSGDCASGSCQPAVVLHVSSSLQPKLSTGRPLPLPLSLSLPLPIAIYSYSYLLVSRIHFNLISP